RRYLSARTSSRITLSNGYRSGSPVRTSLSRARIFAAFQPFETELVDSSSISVAVAPAVLRSKQGPFPPPELLGFVGTTDPSAICAGRSSPSRVDRSRPPCQRRSLPVQTSLVARLPSPARAAATTPVDPLAAIRHSLRKGRRPSPLLWRVGIHIGGFGACSTFTARCGPR